MIASDLTIRAGASALARIRANGIGVADVRAVAGAAGGPKWLVLSDMDRFVFGEWLPAGNQHVHMVGSSSGAWRFAAACAQDPRAAFDKLEAAYVAQQFGENPDRDAISAVVAAAVDSFVDRDVIDGMLHHPRRHLTIITARSRQFTNTEQRHLLMAGAGVGVLGNCLRRSWVGTILERVLFQSPSMPQPPVFAVDGIPTRRVSLTAENARDVVYASGSIPLLMRGMRNPADAPPGIYRDGGLVDYHIDQPLCTDGLVLMPHFADCVTPGWFDKKLRWRHARFTDNLVLLSPSPSFLARLPNCKVPDRKDYYLYHGRDVERVRDWHKAIDAGRRLTDAFREWLQSDDPARHMQPL